MEKRSGPINIHSVWNGLNVHVRHKTDFFSTNSKLQQNCIVLDLDLFSFLSLPYCITCFVINLGGGGGALVPTAPTYLLLCSPPFCTKHLKILLYGCHVKDNNKLLHLATNEDS